MSHPTIRAALADAVARLTAAGVPGAARDARKLLFEAFECRGVDMNAPMPATGLGGHGAAARFETMVAARQARVPVSQILGRREFYGRAFLVTKDVLDPRPETETLIETALGAPFSRVLDLGTGSGAILWTLLAERPMATGIGTDISEDALDVARANPLFEDYSDRAQLVLSDWFENVEGTFDLIVSNPPYIETGTLAGLAPEVRDHEPRMALDGGVDGLDPYRIIAAQAGRFLIPGGRVIVEIGPDQGRAVAKMLQDAGFDGISICADLDGRDRVVLAKRGG